MSPRCVPPESTSETQTGARYFISHFLLFCFFITLFFFFFFLSGLFFLLKCVCVFVGLLAVGQSRKRRRRPRVASRRTVRCDRRRFFAQDSFSFFRFQLKPKKKRVRNSAPRTEPKVGQRSILNRIFQGKKINK